MKLPNDITRAFVGCFIHVLTSVAYITVFVYTVYRFRLFEIQKTRWLKCWFADSGYDRGKNESKLRVKESQTILLQKHVILFRQPKALSKECRKSIYIWIMSHCVYFFKLFTIFVACIVKRFSERVLKKFKILYSRSKKIPKNRDMISVDYEKQNLFVTVFLLPFPPSALCEFPRLRDANLCGFIRETICR